MLEGDILSPARRPSGGRFHTRCPYTMVVCATADPPPFRNDAGTTVFCHLHTTGPTLVGAPMTGVPPTS